jgi:outer membrane protein OmpA-like peptidoglycan-associated protein
MEQLLGHDFRAIRVHTDRQAADSAAAVASTAYTVGNHIVLGRIALSGDGRRRVMSHELVHTMQQHGEERGTAALPISSPSDPAEQEAQRIANQAIIKPAADVDGSADRPAEAIGNRQRSAHNDAVIGVGNRAWLGLSPPSTRMVLRQAQDAGPSDDPARRLQVACVIRLGGCTQSRPAGVPTREEILSYNARCREHRPYAEDVFPTDDECRYPPTEPLLGNPHSPAEAEAERVAAADTESSAAGARTLRVSGPAVQRACGEAEIGSPAGCAERGGDIADFGTTSEDVFLFVPGCDDMAAGESTRLAAYATRIESDDEVTIDGFASEEGPALLNLDLACARVRAAAGILTVAGVVPSSMRLYSHGATPGDRPIHRSVVITVSRPQESRPSTTIFHPGVMHDHKPSGRWADVQADPNSDFLESWACKLFSPRGVAAIAIDQEFGDKRVALEHLNWYLGNGQGSDFDENDNLEAMLLTEPLLQKIGNALASQQSSGTSGTRAFDFRFDQGSYTNDDFRFAFGTIDRLDCEVDFGAGTLHVWFQDRYEWHPVYPFYSKFPDDVARGTNCVHAAMVELKSGGARDYWMKGEATIPLSKFRSAP